MNRKRSEDNLPQRKRLKTPSVTQASTSSFNAMPQTPSTSAVLHRDRDRHESPTTSYHETVFPSETAIPPLGIQDTDAIISGTCDVSLFQSSLHQGGYGVVQSREVLYEAALEEHYQDLQHTQTEDLEGKYFQHGSGAQESSAQTFDNVLSGKSDSLLEGLTEFAVSQGVREASIMSHEISNGPRSPYKTVSRSEKSIPSLSIIGASTHDPYDSGRTLAEVYNIPHTQSRHIAVPSPLFTQFPMQNMLQSARKVNIAGNASLMNIARDNVVTNVVKCDGAHGLEKMKDFVSFSAQFDSFAQDPERICHTGTRQNVLKCMKYWIDDPSSTERIFWLHGPAGAGKSAIAQTIAQSSGRQKVPATFFFFRSDSGRNDGNMLFTTLAYQLALSIPTIKYYIVQSLHERPDLPMKGVEIQFNNLIAQPFRSLAEAASQQSSPDSIVATINGCQQLAPVIIIDGVDECTDEKLQQRILKIVGNAVKDNSFPFRFLICSRSEAHIEETLNMFKALVLPTNLAKLDDANRDIEKYLVDQFSSIASNRDLDLYWPGQEVIQDIIYKSSGNFIFASVVIKVVGDEDSMPEEQLAIILNLKPPEGVSPFTVLDELYLEILRRQRHQDFLKTFLALLVGRTALSRPGIRLFKDDAKLMNVSERKLHTKLRRMRSLLKFEPYIDLHHRSFLDFLHDLSRSGDYYVSKQAGTRRYVELVVDSIVRHVSKVIENPAYHETHHFSLDFAFHLNEYPNDLFFEGLRDVLQRLVQIQNEVLKLADSCIATDLLSCEICIVFHIMHTLLLHLAFHRCIDVAYYEVAESVTKDRCTGVMASISTEAIPNSPGNDLDMSLSSLLTHLQDTKLDSSPSTTIIKHTYSILQFDCAEIVVRIQSIPDAQRLVDLLVYLIDEKYILSQYKPDVMSKAARLVLWIFSRIPVLPRSLLLNVQRSTSGENDERMSMLNDQCTAALIWRVLDKNYIHLEMDLQGYSLIDPSINLMFKNWEQIIPLDSNTVIELVLEVASAIQYLHSTGVALRDEVDFQGQVYIALSLRPRIRISTEFLDIMSPFMGSKFVRSLYEDSIFAFGCFFYAAYFNIDLELKTFKEKRQIIAERPSSPKIPEYAWQLIQRCCVEDPEDRPTIDEVVREMETWGNQQT